MNAAATHKRHSPSEEVPGMNGPLTFSVLFHAIIVILSIVGLPYLAKDYPLIDNSIAVEIVEIDKITQTNKPPVPKATPNEDKAKAQPLDAPPKVSEMPKPAAPTVDAKEPPKPTAPERPDDIAPPVKDAKPPEKMEKPVPPKPKTRPAPPKPEEKAAETQEFDSLLRNLMTNDPQSEAETNEGQGEKQTPQAPLGDAMTMSELDSLRHQWAACWKLMAGARYAEDLIVEIKLVMNPDGSVRDARIVDQIRYNQDNYFRAAADSAYRAVLSPGCNPLKLPLDKYQQWKDIKAIFDPREML